MVSSLSSYAIIPRLNQIAKSLGLIDKPSERKIHVKPLVRVGGISIFLGFNFSFLLVNLLSKQFITYGSNLYTQFDELTFPIILCATGFFIIGLIDDIFNLSPFSRLFFQFLISVFLWSLGLRVENILIFNSFFKEYTFLLEIISLIFTIVWIVGVTNAINWFDGLDGLAAGITFITSLGFIYLSFYNKNLVSGYFSLCLAGSSFGFLLKNFYPASILMGDSGSYFLGIQLAILSLLSTNSYSQLDQLKSGTNFNIFAAFCYLILPLLDMIYVISKRLLRNKSPFYADKSHLHHRLLNLGYSHKNVVFIILSLTICTVIFTTSLAVNI